MLVKDVVEGDFLNYKKPSMFIIFPTCTFKCEKDCGIKCCQNWEVVKQPNIEISPQSLVTKYLKNDLCKSIVCGGLEPFDSWEDLITLIDLLRKQVDDDIVIYTGYKEEEIEDKICFLKQFKNIVLKVGRYVPNQISHYDEVLGITLASPNQYAIKIS